MENIQTDHIFSYISEKREAFPCQLLTPLHHQMPMKPFGGLQVDHGKINIVSETPLERLAQFEMFKGGC
jgi:hypothetical protein